MDIFISKYRCLIISTDKIREALLNSSKKLASEIAQKTIERKAVELQLKQFTEHLIIAEAKIEVHRENRDSLNALVQDKKQERSDLFDRRDELIEKKRTEQQGLYDEYNTEMKKDKIAEKVALISDEIGEVIDKNKIIANEMQELYEESQEEHNNMLLAIKEHKEMSYDTEKTILSYQKKMADRDAELTNLRRKMADVLEKLDKD
jgi:uncharacterized coiled-coil DUF342 family protein